jgi:predicted CXXCH cytochrome family protein
MKKLLVIGLAVALVLSLGSLALAGMAPGTGIIATYHDLSSTGAAAALGDTADQAALNRICIYCHAPHNTIKPELTVNTYRPLWNHNPSLIASYTMYANTLTADAPGSVAHQSQAMALLVGVNMPGSVSLLCLSCHDGSTATNSYGYASNLVPGRGTAPFNMITARATIGGGGDLSNHHPIGFSYIQTLAAGDTEIHLDTTVIPNGGVGQPLAGGPASVADLLWNGNVECVSCHDVHNTKNGGDKFTWVQDTQSALCLTCHVKDGTAQ